MGMDDENDPGKDVSGRWIGARSVGDCDLGGVPGDSWDVTAYLVGWIGASKRARSPPGLFCVRADGTITGFVR